MTANDKFLQYTFGWHHGAGRQGMDPKRAEHKDKAFAEIYLEGFEDGRIASRKASDYASRRFAYKPKIIRAL